MLYTEVQKVWRKFFTFRSNIYQPCLLFCIGREGVGGWLNLIHTDQQYVKCIIRTGGGGGGLARRTHLYAERRRCEAIGGLGGKATQWGPWAKPW